MGWTVAVLWVSALVGWTTLETVDSTCPTTLSLGWREYNTSCYWLSTFKDSWQEARKACVTEHPQARLASIHDLMENSFITEMIDGKHAWIGLNDIEEEGQYTWSTGVIVDFLYWASGQPDDLLFNQDCVHIYDSMTGQWDDEDCSLEKHFICKMPVVSEDS